MYLPEFRSHPTFDPQVVLRGGYIYEQLIVQDFKRFKQPPLKLPSKQLPQGEVIGFDTEYDINSNLLTVGIADRHRAVAFEVTEAGWKKTVAGVLKKAKVLCGHSIDGDLDHLVLLGLARDAWLRGVDIKDSLLLARMHNEDRGGKGSYGLENLMLSEFSTEPWKGETEILIKLTGNAAHWTPQQRIDRCRLDAWATVVLALHFEKEIAQEVKDGTSRSVY